jgi:transposase
LLLALFGGACEQLLCPLILRSYHRVQLEAVRRPTMRFVEAKSAEQQGRLIQHRTRDLLMRQRTQVINALRAHLAELGIVAAQGREGLEARRTPRMVCPST